MVDIWFWTGFGALNPYNEESRNSSLHVKTCFNFNVLFSMTAGAVPFCE